MIGWDWWLAIFCVLIIVIYALHEWYCAKHPERRARNHWPSTGHGRTFFQDLKRFPQE